MIKLVILIINCLLFVIINSWKLKAQDMYVSTGFGYYDPQLYKGEGSNIFYTNVNVKLPTDYFLGFGFGMSDVYTEYDENDQLFGGFRSIQNYYHFRILINREFAIGKKKNHFLRSGTGIMYKQLRYSEPFVEIIKIEEGIEINSGLNSSNREQDDAGMLLSLGYEYRFNRVGIGLYNEVHILLNVGFGGFVIAPNLSFSF